MKNESANKSGGLPDNLSLRYGVYHADFRIDGRRRRVSLKTDSLMMAKQRLKEVIAGAQRNDAAEKTERALTMSEWGEEYISTHLLNRVEHSISQGIQLLRKVIVPYLGAQKPIDEVTTASLIRLRSERWGKLNAATQNRKFALVKHFFSEARRRKLIKDDPARDVSKLKESPKKSKTLSDQQIKQVLLASGEPFRSYVLLSVSTGLRKGELLKLRKKHVEFDEQTDLYWLHLRNEDGFRTKSGRDRKVPVHPMVQFGMVMSKLREAEELIFKPTGNGKLYRPRHAWNKVRSRLKLHDVTLHGLRRTFGTILHRRGVPIGTIQELMGHSTVNQTRAYIDTNHEELALGIRGLDQTFESLFTGENEKVWSRFGHE